LSTASGWAEAVKSRPNVLLILADDLGYSDLGCYGSEIPTPNIDRLAGRGIRFTQCYNSARCCPSRASLLTGLYPHEAGIGSFTQRNPDPKRGPAYLGRLNQECVTIAEMLKSSGYQTYMVGKWHVGAPGPIARGFDEFYGFTEGYAQDQWSPDRYQRLPETRTPELTYDRDAFYATDAFNDYAMEFLKQARQKAKPWFLYVAHSSPHFPVQAPKASVDRFVETYERGWDTLRAERFARMQRMGLATDAWQLTSRSLVPVDRDDIANGYSGQPNPAWDSLPEDRRHDLARRMAVFAAMVSHVDQGVGQMISDLEAHGELDNTLVIFLSDNGACYEWGPFGFDGPSRQGVTTLHEGTALENMGGPGTHHAYGSAWANLGNTPFRMYKHFTQEGGIATPLILHWPAGLARENRWVREPVHIMDILPTIGAATHTPYPKTYQGRDILPNSGVNLLPVCEGQAMVPRTLGFEHQEARALREGRWKVVWSKRMPYEIDWELYDFQTDRCETVNLADQFPDRTRAMADAWMAWARKVKVYPFFESSSQE
jgi:arylsulfatase